MLELNSVAVIARRRQALFSVCSHLNYILQCYTITLVTRPCYAKITVERTNEYNCAF